MSENQKKRSERQKTVHNQEKTDPAVPPITEIAAKSGTFQNSDKSKTNQIKRKRRTILDITDLIYNDEPIPNFSDADIARLRDLIRKDEAVGKLIVLFSLKIARTK